MPHVTGLARRSGVYAFRLPTDGTGDPPTQWPPISPPEEPTPGSPVLVVGPLSRVRPRLTRGPSIATSAAEERGIGSPVLIAGPTSRLRPRFVRPPGLYEDIGPVVDIYALPGQVLQAGSASFSFVNEDEQAQQDIYDVGSVQLLQAGPAVIPSGSPSILGNYQVGDATLEAGAASFVAASVVVDAATVIGGGGVLQAGDAQIESTEGAIQTNRAAGDLIAGNAEFVGAVVTVEIPPFSAEQVAQAVANMAQAGGRFTFSQSQDILLVTQVCNTFGFKPRGQYQANDEFGFYWFDGVTKVITGRYDPSGQRLVLTIELPQEP